MLVVAAVVWYVLERTPAGRQVYATGGNPEAASRAGIRTSRVILFSLVTCGVMQRAGGSVGELAAGDRRPDDRPRISAADDRRGVLGLHSVSRWALQRVGHGRRRIRLGHGRQGPAARRRTDLDPRHVQRRRASCSPSASPPGAAARRRPGPSPFAACFYDERREKRPERGLPSETPSAAEIHDDVVDLNSSYGI